MLKCKCACHEKEKRDIGKIEKFIGAITEVCYAFFKMGIWAGVYMFLVAGAFASILLVIKLIPESAFMIKPFIILQNGMFKIALGGGILFLVFGTLKYILKLKNNIKYKEVR